jgi:basic membrane protein A
MQKGAEYVTPDFRLNYALTGSWNDAAKGKELAISQITTSNVDVIMGYASACNVGMIEACEEYGAKFIATPGANDTNPDTIVGSVIMSNGMLIKLAVGHILAGTAQDNLIYTGTVADGVITLGTSETASARIFRTV